MFLSFVILANDCGLVVEINMNNDFTGLTLVNALPTVDCSKYEKHSVVTTTTTTVNYYLFSIAKFNLNF